MTGDPQMQVKCKQPTVIDQNFAIIPLSHGMTTIIDPDDFEEIAKHKWKVVRSSHCFYAVRDVAVDGVIHRIRMHRVIAKTPDDQICHHKNRQSLDNRKINLRNMFQPDHQALHDFLGHGRNEHREYYEQLS